MPAAPTTTAVSATPPTPAGTGSQPGNGAVRRAGPAGVAGGPGAGKSAAGVSAAGASAAAGVSPIDSKPSRENPSGPAFAAWPPAMAAKCRAHSVIRGDRLTEAGLPRQIGSGVV